MATAKKTIVKKKITAIKKPVAKDSAHIPVYAITGEKTGTMTAPVSIFNGKINMQLIAQAVRVYLANQREGSAATKTRGQVEGSTRKIYKQKGTGRARHGGIRAPIFVGGGIVFGPHPRSYYLHLPQSMKNAALKSALSLKLKENAIFALSDVETMKPKTKIVASCFDKIGAKRSILLIVSDMKGNLMRAARNIENVYVEPAQNVTAYHVAMSQKIIITKEAMKQMEKRLA
ncbi:MAG: 50S ribosomal protein L4 [Candidatus Gottesmanbacteria bacterium]